MHRETAVGLSGMRLGETWGRNGVWSSLAPWRGCMGCMRFWGVGEAKAGGNGVWLPPSVLRVCRYIGCMWLILGCLGGKSWGGWGLAAHNL